MVKYLLKSGMHVTGRGAGRRVYNPGDVIETDTDLTRFNVPNAPPKFEVVHGDAVAAAAKKGFETVGVPADGLDAMTVADLRAMAAEEEIDLGGAATKAAIVAAIRAANQPIA